MNNGKYEGRINDWVDFTGLHYGLDQMHAKLLAAVLLPLASGVEPTWLCVESPFHKFWGHLGLALGEMGLPPLLSHHDLYTERPKSLNSRYKEILSTRSLPRIMVDSHFTRPMPYTVNVRSRFPLIRSQFIRVRVPIPVTTLPPVGAEHELARLLRLVLDREHRTVSPKPMQLGGLLENLCTLLTLLNPELAEDSQSISTNVGMLGPAWAVLHGREKMEPEDNLITLHVMKSAVRVWTARVLGEFGDGGVWTVPQLATKLGMSRKLVWDECSRLAWNGVLDWPEPVYKGNRRRYIKVEGAEWGEEMRGLISGEVRWW